MYMRCVAALATGALMGSCAIHPVPEQVTGLDTADIVKQIRCETRDAARKIILDLIGNVATSAKDPIAQELFDRYHENQDLMVDFNPNRAFPGDDYRNLRNALNLIYGAAAAYTFELTMNETNNIGSITNFLGAWQATFTMGLTGDLNRSRQNVRTFTITDKFSFLLRELNRPGPGFKPYCNGHIALGPNYIYPIAGKIGVYNTAYTFFQLSVFENLAATDAKPGVSGAPVMSDDLTFTTLVDLLPTPKISFVRINSGFQATDTSLNGNFARQDMHEVTVALALEPTGTVAFTALRGFVFSGAGGSGSQVTLGRPGTSSLLVLNRITASATSRAEQVALLALDQLKSSQIKLKAAQ